MNDIQQIVNNATSAMAGQGPRMAGRRQAGKPGDARMQAISRRLANSKKKSNG
jgi:hypothetical protein